MGKASLSINQISKAADEKTQPSEAIQLIQSFRQNMSLSWINDFIKSNLPSEMLVDTWINLFELADSSDMNIRVATFNAIGALISMVSPIYPYILTDTFKSAFPSLKVSPNKSIAIISTYLYLINYLPFSMRPKFIESVNIMPHFSTDISLFIQHIPILVPLMKPLEIDFQRAFMNNLLAKFAKKPNMNFNEAVLQLVKLNMEILIPDLIEYLINNECTLAILSIASTFLMDHDVSKYLCNQKVQYLDLFSKTAVETLKNINSQLGDVERGVSVISSILTLKSSNKSIIDDNEFPYLNIEKMLKEIPFDQYPKHYQKFIVQIDPSIKSNLLESLDSDSQIMKQSKLRALVHINDPDFVLSVFDKFSQKNEKGDTFTTFVDCFRICFNKIKNTNKKTVASIIGRIILAQTNTWVEKASIINLIGEINTEGALYMNDFEETSINILLNSAISPYRQLLQISIKNLCKLATQDTLDIIINFIYLSDLFNEKVCHRILIILNSLINEFGPYRFTQFQSLVREILLFNGNMKIIGQGFRFLRKINYQADPELVDFGINWIRALYKSYTQLDLNLTNISKSKNSDDQINIQNVISIIDTDITSSDLRLNCTASKSLFSIFKFLVQQEIGNAISVFPEMIQLNPNLIKLCHISYEEILKIFTESRSYKTAAIACDEMKHDDPSLKIFLPKIIDRLIKDPSPNNVSVFASLFRLISTNNVYEKKIKNKLTEAEFKLFQMKLKKAKHQLTQSQYNELPVNELEQCIEYIEPPIIIEDLNELDFSHLRFIFEYNLDYSKIQLSGGLFEILKPEMIKDISKMSFQKINNRKFRIQNFEKNTTSSLTPGLFSGEFSFNRALVTSFFRHSEFKVSQQMFDDSLNNFMKLLNDLKSNDEILQTKLNNDIETIIQYSTKFHMAITDEIIIKLIHEIQRLSPIKPEFLNLLPLIYTKINDKAKILSELFNILNHDPKEEKSLLHFIDLSNGTSNYSSFYDFAVALDIENQFGLLLKENFELKKIWLKKLCFWVQRFGYAGDDLMQFIQSIFESIDQIQSNNKIQYILRLVQSFLYSLAKECTATKDFHPKNKMPFVESLFDFFEPIRKSDIDSLHIEISSIFNYVFLFVRPTEEVVSFFNDYDLKLKNTSVYLRPMVTSFVLAGYSSYRMSKSGMVALLSSNYNSTKYAALKAFQTVLHPNASLPSFCLFEMSMGLFFKIAEANKESKEFASVIASIFANALNHPKLNSIVSTFIPDAISVAFTIPPSSASFCYYAPVLSDLLKYAKPSSQTIQNVSLFMERIENSDNSFYGIPKIYADCVDWQLSAIMAKEPSKNNQKIMELKSLKLYHLQRFFTLNPDPQTRKVFLNAILNTFEGHDRVTFVFSKVISSTANFLQSYVLICEYLRNCSREEKEKCNDIINRFSNVFSSKDVVESLTRLLQNKIMEGAVIAAQCL